MTTQLTPYAAVDHARAVVAGSVCACPVIRLLARQLCAFMYAFNSRDRDVQLRLRSYCRWEYIARAHTTTMPYTLMCEAVWIVNMPNRSRFGLEYDMAVAITRDIYAMGNRPWTRNFRYACNAAVARDMELATRVVGQSCADQKLRQLAARFLAGERDVYHPFAEALAVHRLDTLHKYRAAALEVGRFARPRKLAIAQAIRASGEQLPMPGLVALVEAYAGEC
jgi:hypothetical protein